MTDHVFPLFSFPNCLKNPTAVPILPLYLLPSRSCTMGWRLRSQIHSCVSDFVSKICLTHECTCAHLL